MDPWWFYKENWEPQLSLFKNPSANANKYSSAP
jgi:hypothetical protein